MHLILFITIEEILENTNSVQRVAFTQSLVSNAIKTETIIDILPPNESFERRSLVFIAFEHVPDKDRLIKSQARYRLSHELCSSISTRR